MHTSTLSTSRFLYYLIMIITSLLLLPSCVPVKQTVPTKTSTLLITNTIARVLYSYGNIYLANADGSKLEQITRLQGAGSPTWSPDGNRIAFISRGTIYLINTNNSKPIPLTNKYFPLGIDVPTWSPNGQEIAFASYGGSSDGQIYILSIEKALQGDLDNALKQINHEGIDAKQLTWSPTGEYLAFFFSNDLHQPNNVAVMNVDAPPSEGLQTIIVTDARNPVWSPDGKQMLYVGQITEDQTNIHIIADTALAISKGTTRFFGGPGRDTYPRLTDTNMDDSPSWSPDSKQIVFTSKRDGNWEIYKMSVDGSHQTRLTNTPAIESVPCWSPDGKQIAFLSNRDGAWEIYVMNVDGSDPKKLSNDDGKVTRRGPIWQPQVKP